MEAALQLLHLAHPHPLRAKRNGLSNAVFVNVISRRMHKSVHTGFGRRMQSSSALTLGSRANCRSGSSSVANARAASALPAGKREPRRLPVLRRQHDQPTSHSQCSTYGSIVVRNAASNS